MWYSSLSHPHFFLPTPLTSDLHRATGVDAQGDKRLNRVLQLTGFSDPVYAEAYITVHQYDVVMDVTVGLYQCVLILLAYCW